MDLNYTNAEVWELGQSFGSKENVISWFVFDAFSNFYTSFLKNKC